MFACQLRVDPYSASAVQATAALASLDSRSVRYHCTCFSCTFIASVITLFHYRKYCMPSKMCCFLVVLFVETRCLIQDILDLKSCIHACLRSQIVVQASVSQNFTGSLLQTTGSTLTSTHLPNLTVSVPYYLRVGVVPPIPAPVSSLAYNIASLLPALATSWTLYSAGNGSMCASAAVCTNCPMPPQPAPVTVVPEMPSIGVLLVVWF